MLQLIRVKHTFSISQHIFIVCLHDSADCSLSVILVLKFNLSISLSSICSDSIPEECLQCHAQAKCVLGLGCQCKPGFQGNGTSCSPEPGECFVQVNLSPQKLLLLLLLNFCNFLINLLGIIVAIIKYVFVVTSETLLCMFV